MNTSQTLLGPGCFVLTAAIALPRYGKLDSSKGLMGCGEEAGGGLRSLLFVR